MYDLVQDALGATRARTTLIRDYIRPSPGMRLLDMGCGTGALLSFLPELDYVGVDLSEQYIAAAKQRNGDRGTPAAPNRRTGWGHLTVCSKSHAKPSGGGMKRGNVA